MVQVEFGGEFCGMRQPQVSKPIIFSCSGECSAGQMSLYLAKKLAEGSGSGKVYPGDVDADVIRALEEMEKDEKTIVIDGCQLSCARSCLRRHSIQSSLYFDLGNFGVKPKFGEDFDRAEADRILSTLEQCISRGTEILETAKIPAAKTSLADIRIEEVITKKQLRDFVEFPNQLYRENPYYVPQLTKDVLATFDKERNPAFAFCEAKYWLAYKDGKLAGRIAGIINHAWMKIWKQPFLRFGWFDFEEDEELAAALLQKVESWARGRELIGVMGPLGFTNFDYAGMLTEGFEQQGTFATIYNHPYYSPVLERAGYKKQQSWVEYRISVGKEVPEKIRKAASIVERRLELSSWRPATSKDILPHARSIFKLLNASYAGLFGMVPLTETQIRYNTEKYFSFIKPEFVSLVFDKKGELAAFGIAMPSLSKALQRAKGKLYPFGFVHLLRAFRKNKEVDLCLVAVRKDLQGKGVNALLMRDLHASFIEQGVEWAESNPELEENNRVQSLWEHYEARVHKRRSCFVKYLL